jgi:hypothetical protein
MLIWFLLLTTLGGTALALLLVGRLKEDAEYERTRRHRERWWDF